MKDKNKTKEELIKELTAMRRHIDELKTLEINRQRTEEKIKHHNYYDSLTGLPNRSFFYDRLTKALLEVNYKEEEWMVAVLFLSLDRFKLINDTLGHHIGDILLKAVTERLKRCIRKSDTLARPGRDEFMLLLTEITDVEDVKHIVEKIFSVFNSPFFLENHELFLTVSIGISLYPNDGSNAETLIKNSYTAMNRAKEENKNVYQFYSPFLTEIAFQKLLKEHSIRLALKREEFLLYYQPQIDLNTGKIIGMEALLRWHCPGMGLVYPAEFIPLLEETGLIIPLSEWVLYTACKQNMEWQSAGFKHLRVVVNLSPQQFQQKNLIEIIQQILNKTGLDPQYLEFEMIECSIMNNESFSTFILHALNEIGIKVSIDDFGTGYSSLSYLRHFPISKLKIDRSFVDSITTDPNDEAISRAIISMAHSLRLKVIAEGVETVDQLEFLRSLKCDEAQGNLFSHPLSAEETIKILAEEGY